MRPLWVICVVAALCGGARADDKPWAAGVSDENQKKALDLYNQGAEKFKVDDFKGAIEIYESALPYWDHPAIRYNLALCQINIDRVVEAYDNLERAMKFGEAPLGHDQWKQAQTYQRMLAGRVAEIQVNAEPGASVSLDGKPLAESHQRVLSGDHQIVVEKPRYLTETRAVKAAPGQTVVINITLKPVASVRELHRRWARWVPWTVMGGGLVVAAVGAPFMISASGKYDDYNTATAMCPCVKGTPAGDHLDDLTNQAKLRNNIAVSLFVGGGAIAATGFIMVILNQPRLVTPDVGRDHVGLAFAGRF
ncbi:MAG: PEGA domain-containing protein [Kofleriaceae bacterium]